MYELVHDEDVIGLQAIKTYFWDRGQPSVEAYIRRQSVVDTNENGGGGDPSSVRWVWLAVRVAAYLDVPIPGAVLHERIVPDINFAKLVNKTSRVVALILVALEQSSFDSSTSDRASAPNTQHNLTAADVSPIMQYFLTNEKRVEDGPAQNKTNDNTVKSPANKPSLLEMLKSRASLDLSRINLNAAELKIISYVLTSRISIDDLFHVILDTFNSPSRDLSASISSYVNAKHHHFSVPTQHHTYRSLVEDKRVYMEATQTDAASISVDASSQNHSKKKTQGTFIMQPNNPSSSLPTVDQAGTKYEKSSSFTLLPRSLSDRGKLLYDAFTSATTTSDITASTNVAAASLRRSDVVTQSKPKRFSRSHKKRNIDLLETETSSHHVTAPGWSPLFSLLPQIETLNLSYTGIGCQGVEFLSETLISENPFIKSLDLSFCSIEDRGILSLCRALHRRKSSNFPHIEGLFISGNFLTYKGAKELGIALSTYTSPSSSKYQNRAAVSSCTVDSDENWDDEVDDWDEDIDSCKKDSNKIHSSNRPNRETKRPIHQGLSNYTNNRIRAGDASSSAIVEHKNCGLLLLHVACVSLTPESLHQLLLGLGQNCPIRELCVASNNLGSSGAAQLMEFLEGRDNFKSKKGQSVMPFLDRIDMSNNNLGNDGTAKITRAISKRACNVNLVELRLSCNEIGHLGIETLMNKLLQQNISNLYMDNNNIGDRGCQLVAASLPSMHHLLRLSLSFNQIGSRGINALMRSLVGCESLEYLALSGNIIKVSGSSAMGFALSQHPRLCSMELENCCLSQAAQCHIAAGIISNRWVPMKSLIGFSVGPPLVAIGALDVVAQQLSNEDCFRIRRDMQMKVIVEWMEKNNTALDEASKLRNNLQLSQSAYHRMLDWLGRIPFDEDELSDLRAYFYDVDGGDNERTSDGNINLRIRGDLLAALGSELVEEIREDPMYLLSHGEGLSRTGLNISDSDGETDHEEEPENSLWNSLQRCTVINSSLMASTNEINRERGDTDVMAVQQYSTYYNSCDSERDTSYNKLGSGRRKRIGSPSIEFDATSNFRQSKGSFSEEYSQLTAKSASKASAMSSIGDERSVEQKRAGKARIYMFRPFAEKLELLKIHAQEMMDHEPDSYQQDIIAQQFAEASLTLLRQLRYHCMNSGLDGWRQVGKNRRKILIVDDSVVTRKMVSRAFEKANFIVDTAANGEEGVAKLKESIYDIAFMDIDMPVMNGFDATKALRDWEDVYRPGARQPICALTAAYVDDFERSELMKFKEAGLDVMESKPCNIPRLFKVVDDVSPMFSDLKINVTQAQTS
jgi:CheY-like chemotaxis protein/Ran GTPase-activating protein (RanGAP) involved in mRNA processing and transport